MKYFVVIISVLLMGCENNNNLSEETILWEFHPKNQQDQWDLQAFQLVNEYQAIQNKYTLEDSLVLKTAVKQLINIADTLLVHSTATDSLTQNIWTPGLQTFRNELDALVLEQDSFQLQAQMNMCTITLLHFLADIGYSKTNVYIFQKLEGDKEFYWIGSSKTSKNPFDQQDKTAYSASFTLQEP